MLADAFKSAEFDETLRALRVWSYARVLWSLAMVCCSGILRILGPLRGLRLALTSKNVAPTSQEASPCCNPWTGPDTGVVASALP